MKQRIQTILLGCAFLWSVLSVRSATLEVIPISAFPAITTLESNYLFVIAIPGVANRALKFDDLQKQIGSGSNLVTSIITNNYFVTNIVQLISNYVTVVGNQNVNTFVIMNMNTNLVGTYNTLTNTYWIDCGIKQVTRTNIYGTLTATNDILFLGITNAMRGSLFSFNVIASGGNRRICFPTNTFHYPLFNTNGMVITSDPTYTTLYTLTLTNGNLFRMTFQSNSVGEFLWTTTGQ